MKDALLAEQNRQKFDIKPQTILKYLECFDGDLNDIDNRKRILDDYIDKIIVSEDTVTISFFYTQERRTLPIKETMETINRTQTILSMFGKPTVDTPASVKMRESLLAYEYEEEPSFF